MPARRKEPKPWERQKSKARASRKLLRILIVSEDTKSSVDYCKAFPIDKNLAEIVTLGTGKNTLSLIEHAEKVFKEGDKSGNPYNECWVLFDKDDFDKDNFDNAIHKVKKIRGMKACWSNECFELWYLLHFQYRHTAIGRDDIKTKLKQLLGKTYKKSDKQIYKDIHDKQQDALKHGKKLWRQNNRNYKNPCTRVHQLVERLNEFVAVSNPDTPT